MTPLVDQLASADEQLWSLVQNMCDGTITAESRDLLEASLCASDSAKLFYAAYIDLHGRMLWRFRGGKGDAPTASTWQEGPVSPTNPMTSTPFGFLSTAFPATIGYSSGWSVAYLTATVITGLLILGFWLMPVSRPEQVATHSVPQAAERQLAPEPLPASVGRITGMVDCKIGDSRVSLGQKYQLASGLMEITYDTGAKVILQGPVTYSVETNGGYLAVGKLTGKLERSGEWRVESGEGAANQKSEIRNQKPSLSTIHYPLFTIRTPTATVTDLGTEFGVEVGPQRESRVYVFKGKVKLEGRVTGGLARRGPNPATENASLMLEEGEGARLQADGRTERFVAAEVKPLARTFVRQVPRVDPHAYARAVLADKPLYYWTFDEPSGPAFEQVRHLAREALIGTGGAGRCSHAAIGSGLALGRAADFSRVPGCFRLEIQEPTEMLNVWAIEFWVQCAGDPDSRPRGQYLLNAGLAVDPNKPGIIFNWPVAANKNELQLYAQEDSRTRDGPIISDNNWHHLILAFYGNGRKMGVAPRVDVVLDGSRRTISRGGFSTVLELRWGTLFVGAAGENLGGPFHGRIDELAFYDLSKLTEKEIEARVVDMARRHLQTAQLRSGNP